ncbi:cupin domain-containing protein [Methylocella silvestris]|uniref:Cupin n=1 Tax=Methylocella silvestris TaxID=199596 RepID=A0A2J7TJ03_METSI|nr:cupin domain-containing protein [Methylocella silvestris]PNG26735.1 cupin [Methylocella silvestris]
MSGRAPTDCEAAGADEIIARLDLSRHPEGGWYKETFRDQATDASGRAASTLIYFLLKAGEVSNWHRIDAAEIWHFYAGAPLALSLSQSGETVGRHILGRDLFRGERPQLVAPGRWWQSAASLGRWTLVGCSVAPGFEFARFELAPKGWRPAGGAA